MRRIILRHISGSKANQVDEFPVDQFKALTLGRDTDQTIHYNPERDDLVSKQHARIFCEEGYDDRFLITDLNSRNGTYVNKQRISGTASIVPGDVIQLGPGGPEFQFDLEPSPDGMLHPTREADPMHETRESVLSPNPSSSLTKPSVGYATVERMLSLYQQSSRRTFVNLIAALVGVIIIVAGGLVYLNLKTTKAMGGKIEEITEKLTPAAIASKYGPAVVFIEVSWRLIDTQSNRPVYHRYVKKHPAYIRVIDGAKEEIFPWLSLDDENNTNKLIGGQGHGSGFAVAGQGFILSTRHVVAPWDTRHLVPDEPVVFDVDRNTWQIYNQHSPLTGEKLQVLRSHVYKRVLTDITLLVKKQRDGYYEVVPNNRFEGRHEFLNVTFPNDKLHMPARLVRTSDQHDVALIKVDPPYNVPKVDMYDSYDKSRPGDKIIVLGYPAVSPDVNVVTKSYDPLNAADRPQKIRSLTVTDGLIGKIIRGEVRPKSGEFYKYYSEIGDVFQLTANATGAGNSGGPVFDDRGRVIGIFAYGLIKTDVRITFAVPIRFGREIMHIKAVFD